MSDSNNIQVPGNGLQVNAGPVTVAASGSMAVQVLLACMVFAGSMYVVWTQNNISLAQSQQITQQAQMLTMQHNGIMAAITQLSTAQENLFLSTMLPNERKKDLPGYIQDKARALVERKAESITEKRAPGPVEPSQGPFEVK